MLPGAAMYVTFSRNALDAPAECAAGARGPGGGCSCGSDMPPSLSPAPRARTRGGAPG
jgi:hypothetical protein